MEQLSNSVDTEDVKQEMERFDYKDSQQSEFIRTIDVVNDKIVKVKSDPLIKFDTPRQTSSRDDENLIVDSFDRMDLKRYQDNSINFELNEYLNDDVRIKQENHIFFDNNDGVCEDKESNESEVNQIKTSKRNLHNDDKDKKTHTSCKKLKLYALNEEWKYVDLKKNKKALPPEKNTYDNFGLNLTFLENLGLSLPLKKTVIVNGLHGQVNEGKLLEVFSMAGEIRQIELSKHNRKQTAKIEYDHPVEAVQAISMFNNHKLYDQVMSVTMGVNNTKTHLPTGLSAIGKGFAKSELPLRHISVLTDLSRVKELLSEMGRIKKVEVKDPNSPFLFHYKKKSNNPINGLDIEKNMRSCSSNNVNILKFSVPGTGDSDEKITTKTLNSSQSAVKKLIHILKEQGLIEKDKELKNVRDILNALQSQSIVESDSRKHRERRIKDNTCNNEVNESKEANTQISQQQSQNKSPVPHSASSQLDDLNVSCVDYSGTIPNPYPVKSPSEPNNPHPGSGKQKRTEFRPISQKTLETPNILQPKFPPTIHKTRHLRPFMPRTVSLNNARHFIQPSTNQNGPPIPNTSPSCSVPRNLYNYSLQNNHNINLGYIKNDDKYDRTPKMHPYDPSFRPEMNNYDNRSNRGATTLVFQNLPRSVHEERLASKMQHLGGMIDCRVVGGGRAVVRFRTAEDSVRCLRLFHGSKMDGHVIDVFYE